MVLSNSAYKPPSVHDVDDFVGWRDDKRCTFTVRSIYLSICEMERDKSDKI